MSDLIRTTIPGYGACQYLMSAEKEKMMPELNEKEKMILRLALTDRLNRLYDSGVPESNEIVKDTQALLLKMRTTL